MGKTETPTLTEAEAAATLCMQLERLAAFLEDNPRRYARRPLGKTPQIKYRTERAESETAAAKALRRRDKQLAPSLLKETRLSREIEGGPRREIPPPLASIGRTRYPPTPMSREPVTSSAK